MENLHGVAVVSPSWETLPLQTMHLLLLMWTQGWAQLYFLSPDITPCLLSRTALLTFSPCMCAVCMPKVSSMGREGCRLSPGNTRSRGQREADRFAHPQPSCEKGEHSVWCDIRLVEVGFRPLEATNVLLVVTCRKIFLRVVATGFVFTIHLEDIVQVRHVVPAHAVELHVEVPSPASLEDHKLPGCEKWYVPATHRLYRIYPKQRGSGSSSSACAQLFQVITSLLSAHAQQASEESDLDDAIAWYERTDACSMLPYHLCEEVGLRELESASYALPHIAFAAGVTRLSATHAEVQQHPPTWRQAQSALPLASSCSGLLAPGGLFGELGVDVPGHLRRIYVVPSPGFWRLPKASSPSAPSDLLWHGRRAPDHLHCDASSEMISRYASTSAITMQRQHTMGHTHEPRDTLVATGAPASYYQLQPQHGASQHEQPTPSSSHMGVGMNNRESSLMVGMCGLHPRAIPAPPLSLSSRAQSSSPRARQPVSLEYGPTTSG
ncbi:hypothetical protein, conserved [Leishmania lindenbergi]|uniref:Cyclic nucleotide-binding domain-containing protein n=1 Tax=Leishmania lindenbergi TaxID=651832 RepID=A0AAW3AEP8_9TRYP